MADARSKLLQRVMDEVGMNGLADRSLRELATAIDSSHRMLIFHFGSRAGLLSAVVEAVESAQRDLLEELADEVSDPGELVLLLWERVSSPELLPFVRLFFECVAMADGQDLSGSWIATAETVADKLQIEFDETELRMGMAVTRGLLIDVLATGDVAPATRSIERFVEIWDPANRGSSAA
ncbi:MAG: TetR/AcrR family transcriptional regulator [Acidimicrobiales bacterium]